MRHIVVLCALLAVAGGASASTTTAPSTSKSTPPIASPDHGAETAKENLRVALIYMRNNNIDPAQKLVDQVLRQDDFAQLPSAVRYLAQLLGSAIAEDRGAPERAKDLIVRATALPEADSRAWQLRMEIDQQHKDWRDIALCVATLAKHWPNDLNGVEDRFYIEADRQLRRGGDSAQRLLMLQALFDAGWKTEDGEPDPQWRDLAALHLAKGDTAQAARVAARIASARTLLSMRVDKRFDALTRADPAHYDVDRMLAREVASTRAWMQSSPAQLRPVVRLQSLLLSTQRYEEVIALADQVIQQVRNGSGASHYTDFDQQYIWLLDERSRALARLGRWDEAAQQWQLAARRPEDGRFNVSQVINLGQLYADLQRPQEALATIEELGDMSPFGRMQLEMVRLEAAMAQGDQAAMDAHLAFMRQHRADAIDTWQNALLVSNRLDEATDLLVERLHNDDWRSGALADMQVYASIRTTPVDAVRLQRWREVIGRAKVQEALAPLGRVESFHLDPVET